MRDGVNGLLAPFGDAVALADALRRLLTEPILAARLGAAGRELALERFTWPSVLARVCVAFEVALGYPLRWEEL